MILGQEDFHKLESLKNIVSSHCNKLKCLCESFGYLGSHKKFNDELLELFKKLSNSNQLGVTDCRLLQCFQRDVLSLLFQRYRTFL